MTTKKNRKTYTAEFKAEALKLAERVGVAEAARQLKLYETQIYNWRNASEKKSTTSQREAELAAEVAKLRRQLADQAEDLAILKKGRNLLREKSKVAAFEFMLEHQHRFRLQRMAAVFGVSRSGYYQWRRTGEEPGEKALRRAALDEKINKAFTQAKQRDGARRIQVALAENGDYADLKTILNSMKRQGLKAKAARKFKVTTDSNHQLPVAPNLLEQNFSADAPNQKWVGDITYLLTNEGWLYLAVIIDLYSRAVIGWSMNSRMTAELTCKALQMALLRRGRPKDVIVHSDRGSQYCSMAYRNLIEKHQLIQSMSRKGNCWDNAVAESFFHTLKVELLKDEPLTDRVTLQQQVFEYIEVDYNKTRRHSAIGYLSPENYELKKVA